MVAAVAAAAARVAAEVEGAAEAVAVAEAAGRSSRSRCTGERPDLARPSSASWLQIVLRVPGHGSRGSADRRPGLRQAAPKLCWSERKLQYHCWLPGSVVEAGLDLDPDEAHWQRDRVRDRDPVVALCPARQSYERLVESLADKGSRQVPVGVVGVEANVEPSRIARERRPVRAVDVHSAGGNAGQ